MKKTDKMRKKTMVEEIYSSSSSSFLIPKDNSLFRLKVKFPLPLLKNLSRLSSASSSQEEEEVEEEEEEDSG